MYIYQVPFLPTNQVVYKFNDRVGIRASSAATPFTMASHWFTKLSWIVCLGLFHELRFGRTVQVHNNNGYVQKVERLWMAYPNVPKRPNKK